MTLNNIQRNCIDLAFDLMLINLVIQWLGIAFPSLVSIKRTSKILTPSINLLISISLVSRWIVSGHFPLSNLYESLIFLSWSLNMTQILLERTIGTILVGSIITPITLFITGFATMSLPIDMQYASTLVPALRSNWLMMHVSVMMLSYASLITGSLLSILFLCIKQYANTQYHHDKNNQSNGLTIKRIDLLESLDNLSYRIIGFGFPLLTIGIISGAVWANDAWGSYWSWDPKETWALITWIIFASYLHSRLNREWTGEKPAILASCGFFILWICYLGVNFLGQGLHNYGWVS